LIDGADELGPQTAASYVRQQDPKDRELLASNLRMIMADEAESKGTKRWKGLATARL
jgi:hypothetical protein